MSRELANKFLAGAVRLAKAHPDRHRPSPSSVTRCTRQNWYSETGVPKTEEPDGESFFSAESGRMTESLLSAVLNESGIARVEYLTEEERELQPYQLARVSMKGGQFDQLGFTPGHSKEDDGDLVLVEYKRKGVYDILDLWRKGSVREAKPDEYAQMQVLMEGLQLVRALYIAVNWDRGMLTSHGPGGRYGWKSEKGIERYPGVYLEWVPRVALAAKMLKKRAEMQTNFIENETVAARVPRDYNPFEGRFPCNWCSWWKQCKLDSGGQAAPKRAYTVSEATREGRRQGALTRARGGNNT